MDSRTGTPARARPVAVAWSTGPRLRAGGPQIRGTTVIAQDRRSRSPWHESDRWKGGWSSPMAGPTRARFARAPFHQELRKGRVRRSHRHGVTDERAVIEGVATHDGLESCAQTPRGEGEALTEARAGLVSSREITSSGRRRCPANTEGHTAGSAHASSQPAPRGLSPRACAYTP